jgi:LEA14-like dessication related protein
MSPLLLAVAPRHARWRPLWLLLALSLLACARPRPPQLSPRRVQVAAVSPAGIDLDVQLGVHNPNAFSLSAEAVNGTLYVGNEQRLGRGEARPKQPIPGNSDGVVASRVHIDWADVTALLPLLQHERTAYTFRGEVTLGGESLNVTLPFSLSGELTRAELIQAGMRGF